MKASRRNRWWILAAMLFAASAFGCAGGGGGGGGAADDDADDDAAVVPVPSGCFGNESVSQGKSELVNHHLEEADFQFGCAWSENMDDSHAAAWYALTMTAMLLQNSDLLALVNDACGSGSTDPWNFTYTFCWLPTVPNGTLGALPAQTPPSQKVIDAVVKNVAPVANYVHILLDIAANDVNFKDTFPAAALSDSWVGWNEWHDYRVTTADLYLFKSMAETAGGLITAVQAWNFQVDIANFVNGLNNDCQAIHSLLDHYPSFFTLLDSSRITNAKDLARTALLDYRQFLNLSALDTGSPNQALFWMSLEDIQRALQDNAQALSSLDSPVTINLWDPPDWTELTGRMYAGAFFAQPWDRKALPAFVQDQYNCTPDADFTGLGDHSMHGVFPGWSAADLTRLYHWMLYNYFGIWWNAPY